MIRHCIIPPYMLRSILQKGNARQQERAWATLTGTEQFRGQRRLLNTIIPVTTITTGMKRRTIYDARHRYDLPGRLVRSEGTPKSKDPAVNEAYDGSGATYDLYAKIFSRNSIDNRGLRLDSTVHYGQDFDNAFWNGRQMVFGDGDGQIFKRFTAALDVIGHELTHGVIEFEAGLEYSAQSGALNESFADVFGSLVKQYKRTKTAEEADWLIGDALFMPGVKATAIRSLKEPGTAYDDPILGKDPQPAHMRDYVETSDDNGGVHINSGIPNRAFYELAIRLKGYAWEKAGAIWYQTLAERLRPASNFKDAMNMTVQVAGQLFGRNSAAQKATREAWSVVGI